ncbi:hypothetical protein ABT352_22930 [Streptosporangium sp. NPDC000563]|uniref:hypothetical protein n=1 Tax=Streptosporangium sp. NPDC000563 TaxID=3154366 RepID=UPI003321C0A4
MVIERIIQDANAAAEIAVGVREFLDRLREEGIYRAGAERFTRDAADAWDALLQLRDAAVDWDALVQLEDRAGVERIAREVAAAGRVGALGFLSLLLKEAGYWEGAERMAREAADAGSKYALEFLAQCQEEAGAKGCWSDLLRFGLEADGRISDPW